MLKVGLDFAPGTTDECKQVVTKLCAPEDVLEVYRAGKAQFNTGDLVLTISEQDPSGIEVTPRAEYVRRVQGLAKMTQSLRHGMTLMRGIIEQSAHGIMQLPADSEAMWFVVVRGQAMPIMCVVYATPYAVEAAS